MKVEELVQRQLFRVHPDETRAQVEERLADLGVHALPVIDEDGKAIGIVTSGDLLPEWDMDAPVSDFLSDVAYTIEIGSEVGEAARMMRDLGVHHLVVTDGGEAVGMLSSFDLLRIIDAEVTP